HSHGSIDDFLLVERHHLRCTCYRCWLPQCASSYLFCCLEAVKASVAPSFSLFLSLSLSLSLSSYASLCYSALRFFACSFSCSLLGLFVAPKPTHNFA